MDKGGDEEKEEIVEKMDERELEEERERKEIKSKKEKKSKKEEKGDGEDPDLEQKRKYIDALNLYYSLKNNYEINKDKIKSTIKNREDLSWKEKRAEYLKLKPKCVSCSRPVGTLFNTSIENDERHLIALCGDRVSPCLLNININVGVTYYLEDQIRDDEEEINKYKKEIIIDKNDLLFGYIKSEVAVERFDSIQEKIISTTKLYNYTLEIYQNITDNFKKKEEIENLQVEIYRDVNHFQHIIHQYEMSQNTQLCKDALDLYIETLIPKIIQKNHKMFASVFVDYDEDEKKFNFIQKKFSIEDLEANMSKDGETVISLKQGIETVKKSKLKPNPSIGPAIPELGKKIKMKIPKIKKIKKQLVFEEEEKAKLDDDEEEQIGGNKYNFDEDLDENLDLDLDEDKDLYKDLDEEDGDEDDYKPRITIHY